MLALSGVLFGLALAMRLCPEIPFSRLLHERLIEKPLARLAAMQPADLIYFVLVAIMFVAAGEVIALLGSAELFLVHAGDAAPWLGALVVIRLVAAVSRGKVALQARRAKLSFWHIRALDLSVGTFGRGVRRRREGSGPADNDDDPAPVHAIAA